MYILLDHVGHVTYPLGDDPLEACLKFCEYARQCPSDGVRYEVSRIDVRLRNSLTTSWGKPSSRS